ncbi:MAG TPA: RluA family pseudouridine synthase [Solirubrobacteraceae bacterium]|nr:RluA family pseudouridine synthase [Solirubrobacteraceae bacterium]
MHELEVPSSAGGTRLDAFLAGPLGSRARAQRLLDSGGVRVDGERRAKSHTLAGGETIAIDDPPDDVTAAAASSIANVAVVWEDEHLLVVDKPAGLVVHPAGARHRGRTLVDALAGRARGGPDPQRAGIVHRLDRDTSGLLVVTRDEATHRALRRQIAERKVLREYLALVEGRPSARSGTIDAPIGRDRRVRTRFSTDTGSPRPALTHFALERALPDATLLRVRLETGRTHQIRAHLRAIGHPVAGDPDYGTKGVYGLERQFLHAARLAFDHPIGGARVDVSSELPPDLRRALESAGR